MIPRLITALLLAAAFVAVVLFTRGAACPPGESHYFTRHEVLKDGNVIRLYPIYVCRPVPDDR